MAFSHLSDLCPNATSLRKFKARSLTSSFSLSHQSVPLLCGLASGIAVCFGWFTHCLSPHQLVSSSRAGTLSCSHRGHSLAFSGDSGSIWGLLECCVPRVNQPPRDFLDSVSWLFRNLWGGPAVESCEKRGSGCHVVGVACPLKDPLGFSLPPLVRHLRGRVPAALKA